MLQRVDDRVKWYRDRSARDRYMEEKDILEEEMHRTIKYFSFMNKIWTKMGSECITDQPGSAAYAHKQAAMFGHLEEDMRKKQESAQEKQKEFEAWHLEHRESPIDSSEEE